MDLRILAHFDEQAIGFFDVREAQEVTVFQSPMHPVCRWHFMLGQHALDRVGDRPAVVDQRSVDVMLEQHGSSQYPFLGRQRLGDERANLALDLAQERIARAPCAHRRKCLRPHEEPIFGRFEAGQFRQRRSKEVAPRVEPALTVVLDVNGLDGTGGAEIAALPVSRLGKAGKRLLEQAQGRLRVEGQNSPPVPVDQPRFAVGELCRES